MFYLWSSEAASISGSVDDVIEDELVWHQSKYTNIKVLFSGLMTDWVWTFLNRSVTLTSSPALISQHWPSAPLHRLKPDKEDVSLVWPKLNHVNPHREALPTWQATVLPAIFTLLLSLWSKINSSVLPSCCCVAPDAALLPCVVTIFSVQEMKVQKQNASIIFEKHCDMSHWNQKAAGELITSSFNTCMCIKI